MDGEAGDPGGDPGRRERKKLATRAALVRAALELFDRRGVEATTVEDIADAVDVSARTFHRYFAAKEDVLFADASERREQFAADLAARPHDEPVLESLRIATAALAGRHLADPADERLRLRLIEGSGALRARGLHHSDLLGRVVAAHTADRLRMDPLDPVPRLLAACTIAAFRTARERWLDDPGLDYRDEIDACFDALSDLRVATSRHALSTA